jgi:hypothetical protein
MVKDWLGRCINCGHAKELHNLDENPKPCLSDCPCSAWREEC